MNRNIYEPFKVMTIAGDEVPWNKGTITFFELVMVEEGSGTLQINDHHLPFKAGDLFFLLPQETEAFRLAEPSRIHFIQFQKVYFERTAVNAYNFNFETWFRKLEFIFFNENRLEIPVLKTAEDRETVKSLMGLIIQEHQRKLGYCDIIVQNTLFSILNIVARNLGGQQVEPATQQSDSILSYLQYHIHDPNRLTVNHLAETFHIAPSYFGEYFRRKFDVGLKQYILTYKLKLAENRMKYTDLSLSQIADELGFTDLAHFRKMFARYKEAAPGEHRRQLKAAL
ncbi:MAG TPA: AraC family transcriptional regulator [Chitinophaga sp.]|uniref:AraC family transcriptional regulator n=1 Tax=Chitinophaga sp. TaxID=1869181 RepID=UPI002C66BF80|nr:AraC family transcriptional regulator [Chitinophaga sp.]HVI44195.1 AraC family transcriptional regulator [Chitinophaga sp.]